MSSHGPLSAAPPAQKPNTVTKIHDWLTSPGGRLLRYAVVLLIVGTAVYLSLTGWLQVCEVVESDEDGVTRTCSGPDLTSAGVLASVIFVLLLLWPDLSEFSAFGVTLKKLVQRVDEKASETRLVTREIDRTTTDSKARLESLQSTIAGQASDVGSRLDVIQAGLQSFYEAESRKARDRSDSGTGFPPARGWSRNDGVRLGDLGRNIADFDVNEIVNTVNSIVENLSFERYELGIDAETMVLEGLVLQLFRTQSDRWPRWPTDNNGRSAQLDEVLQLIERMIFSLVAGAFVDRRSLYTAAAILLFLRRG